MSKSNTFENDILKLIFNGTAIANIADDAATDPLSNLYLALHTADPGETGTQSTSECTYGDYARVAVERTTDGWTVTDNSVSPVADIEFPTVASGTETATHASVGVAASGATKILYSGALSQNISIATGVTPIIGAGSTITED